MKNKKIKKSFSKKLNRTVTIVQLTVTAIVAAITVYKMIPKDEKIKNINSEVLIKSHTVSNETEAVDLLQKSTETV